MKHITTFIGGISLIFSGIALAYGDGYTLSSSSSRVVETHHRHHIPNTLSVSVNIPSPPNNYVDVHGAYNHHHDALQWVDMSEGEPLPPNAVVGGNQPYPAATLYICRANYRGGLHPGKFYKVVATLAGVAVKLA